MRFYAIAKTLDKKQWSGFLTYLKLYYRPEGTVCKMANWFDSKSIWKTSQEFDFTSEELSLRLPFKMKLQTISNTISILGKVAEEYLGWMVWKDLGSLKTSCQLQGLAQKSLSDQYLQTQKEVLKESEDKVVSIWDEHYKMLAHFNDYYFWN